MALPAQDTFTASSDSTLTAYSSNWTVNAGGFNVIAASDTVRCTTNDDYAVAYWNADSFNADQYAQIAVNIPANALAWPGPAVRVAASANTYYGVSVGNIGGGSYDVYLSKFVAGTLTDLAYVTRSISAGDVVRLEVSGTSLTVKINGTAVSGLTNISDSSISSGYAGICCYDTDTVTTIDNFEGGNLSGGSQTVSPDFISSTAQVYAPTVTGGSGQAVAPAFISSTAQVYAPTVASAGPKTIAPNFIASTAQVFAPDVLTHATIGGVLTVHGSNGRYFNKGVLAGFHTWASIQDSWPTTPITAFDFDEYLAALVSYGCNFTKAWFLESARDWGDSVQHFSPSPWARTGPGNAADGLPKFDLSAFNQTYFDRLRERIIRCGNAGIYVCVQLFQGWHIAQKGFTTGNPWAYHPFKSSNNINSINGDTNADGVGYETRDSSNTAIFNLQKAYVAKVIDTVNDLDNVFYEIANEEDSSSLTWQRALVDYIQTYEAGKAKQHLVGMTVCWPSGSNTDLYDTTTIAWLSPNGDLTPDAASTAKISAFDTDHINGLTNEYKWIFRAFCQGHHPWYMDEWAGETYGTDRRASATYQRIRANLGAVLDYAAQIDLANATPQGSLSSTGYCLAKTSGAVQLLAYQDASGNFTVDLSSLPGTYTLEWLRTAATSPTTQAGSDVSGGAVRTLTPPWAGEDAVAFLQLSAQEISPAFISSAAQVFSPTVAKADALAVTAGFISSTAQVFSPTVTKVTVQTVTVDFISSTAQVFAPTVAKGTALTIAPAFIASTAEVFAVVIIVGSKQRARSVWARKNRVVLK